jgi:hypothetical protein
VEKSAATAIVVTVSLVVQNRRQGCQVPASIVGWIKKELQKRRQTKIWERGNVLTSLI